MGNSCSYIFNSVCTFVHRILGESRSTICRISAEDDVVVSHKNWKMKCLLNGERDGKFVAEVYDPAQSKTYVMKTYCDKRSAMAEHLVLSRISASDKQKYLLLANEWFYHHDKYYFLFEYEDIDFFSVLSQPSFQNFCKDKKHLVYFRQALEGSVFLHSHDLIHYDLKFENMVFNLRTKNLRLIDFESCADWYESKRFQGTREYMAPEILLFDAVKDYDAGKQDVWSMAVLIMLITILHSSTLPEDVRTTYDYIRWLEKNIPLNHFLWKAFTMKPKERVNMNELLGLFDTQVLKRPSVKHKNDKK